MLKGDISNTEAQRVVFVFEHTVGYLDDPVAVAKEHTLCRLRRWKRAVDCWVIPQQVHTLLWDLVWRYDIKFDIVTFKAAGFGECLADRLTDENIPFANLWAEPHGKFIKRLVFQPSVSRVYDSDPGRQLAYGGRGVHVPGGLAAMKSLW